MSILYGLVTVKEDEVLHKAVAAEIESEIELTEDFLKEVAVDYPTK